jgi:hypothetical protein
VPYRYKAGALYSQVPSSGLGDFTVVRAASNSATRVNAQGFIETVADNVPRIDYPIGGIVAGCPALLVEPSATNSIRNNSMVGAVAGTPGTLPTNHSTTLNGLTRTIVEIGSENGVNYIDVQVSGTATGSVFLYAFETSTQIVAASGQAWTNSMWIKQVADVGGNRPAARLTIYEYTAAGAYVTEGSEPVTLTSSLTRFSFTRTLTGATTARATPIVQFFLNVGTTYNFTVRIGLPQMELGSVATSVIPTTTAAINRGADVINKTGVSSLIGQTQGTLYAEFEYRTDMSTRRILAISDGSQLNRVFLYFAAGSIVAGIQAGTMTVGTPVVGFNKVAFGYIQNGVSGILTASLNGGAVVSGTSATYPASLNTVNVGKVEDTGTGSVINSRIRAFAFYPTRIPNTAPLGVLSLQSLTQ